MNSQDKILAFLKEHDGVARKRDLARIGMNDVTFARAMRSLLVGGYIELCVRITDLGKAAPIFDRRSPTRQHTDEVRSRSKRCRPDYGRTVEAPPHVFKEITDEDINRIREQALSARELAG